MKVRLLVVGKTEDSWLKSAIEDYASRVKRYLPFEIKEIASLKNSANLNKAEWRSREAEKILSLLTPSDHVVLLDEKGTEMTSVRFSAFLGQKFQSGAKTLVFIVGGPFGFDESVKQRADFLLSLSKMTFSHQMVRLFFAEQLYRALTIMKNESYHHE